MAPQIQKNKIKNILGLFCTNIILIKLGTILEFLILSTVCEKIYESAVKYTS